MINTPIGGMSDTSHFSGYPPKRGYRVGLVRYSDQADLVFPGSMSPPSSALAPAARIIHREVMSGRTILDLKRPSQVNLQPSISSYASMFSALTGGLLNGLD